MIQYDDIRRFYDGHRTEAASDDQDFSRGTIESSTAVMRFRNTAEARHLGRVLRLRKSTDVLDLGGGSGRWAAWFARRCRHVTMVDLAPSLVETAGRHMRKAGLGNVTCVTGSILDPPVPRGQRFDVVHIGGVLVYINDADLPRVRAMAEARVARGGTLVLREPVDPAGPSLDERAGGYRAIFRRPEIYAQLFAPSFELRYQRVTVSHLVPAGQTTRSFVTGIEASPVQARIVARVLPLLGHVDRGLCALETLMRRTPLRVLLGDPGVVQHFYVFTRRT